MTFALLAGIAATSVLGSVHCVAMCGPLVGLHGGARTVRLAAIHSLGRLITYATIGALAGAVGSALDLAGRFASVQRAATIVAGIAIITWGLVALLGTRARARAPREPAAEPRSSAFATGLVQIRTRRPAKRALLVGVLTGLLPCGWLWAFAITAAGTGHPVTGALVMTAFWLGTVPAMVGMLALAGPIVSRLRARMPLLTAAVLIFMGIATLASRWPDAGTAQVTSPHCHCHGAA